jgi:hypothetical protein
VSGSFDDDVLADPVAVITAAVAAAGVSTSPGGISSIVARSCVQRAARRRLAQSLKDHPDVLSTGRPPGPVSAARLLLALRQAGVTGVAAPRCSGCERELSSLRSMRGGDWGCSTCFGKWEDCAGCGEHQRVSSRDRRGRARCADCPDNDGDPAAELASLVTGIDPGLTAGAVHAALRNAAMRPAGQRRIAWAVLDRPGLLTGDGSEAPAPAVLRFIGALADAGAAVVVRPACPRCGEVKNLPKLLEGKRVCRNCFARHAAVPCSRCGAVREPATRDGDGKPICPNCLVRDPANLEECAGCGRRRPVAVRDGTTVWCVSCRPRQIVECGICGQKAHGEISRATGQPWCDRCQQWWTRCSGCGITAPARGGTRREPLCARCVNPDPASWKRCPACKKTWQLSTRTCQRCLVAENVRGLLGGKDDTVRPALVPLYEALAGAEHPDSALVWINRPRTRELLGKIAAEDRDLTHEVLDELPAGKALAHLRSVLVATGALPERDEILTRLEQWAAETSRARQDPGERRILHGYATWHHLRKLRQRLGGSPATYLQALNVRCHVTAAARFLDWLAGEGLTLASCRQGDVERWACGSEASYRDETAHFIRWAVEHRHARGLTAGAVRWGGPQGPHDTQKRWDDARRLLHDGTLAIQDRVAGLLLLLYAQHISAITELTTGDVRDDGTTVSIMLGTVPVTLPEPLDGLVRELAATHRGHAAIGRPGTTPWLFRGGRPGQHIGYDRLCARLKNIGLSPQQDRSTALFALAAELPAAILARMLGIHIAVAVQWQRAASGDWGAYAADISRRGERQP